MYVEVPTSRSPAVSSSSRKCTSSLLFVYLDILFQGLNGFEQISLAILQAAHILLLIFNLSKTNVGSKSGDTVHAGTLSGHEALRCAPRYHVILLIGRSKSNSYGIREDTRIWWGTILARRVLLELLGSMKVRTVVHAFACSVHYNYKWFRRLFAAAGTSTAQLYNLKECID